MPSAARHVRITGHVQGVGYRAWVARETTRRGLLGVVRNRKDGSVEAVFSGEAAAVEAMIAACRIGPANATVLDIRTAKYAGPPFTRFAVLATK
jgi:acylphosphatase